MPAPSTPAIRYTGAPSFRNGEILVMDRSIPIPLEEPTTSPRPPRIGYMTQLDHKIRHRDLRQNTPGFQVHQPGRTVVERNVGAVQYVPIGELMQGNLRRTTVSQPQRNDVLVISDPETGYERVKPSQKVDRNSNGRFHSYDMTPTCVSISAQGAFRAFWGTEPTQAISLPKHNRNGAPEIPWSTDSDPKVSPIHFVRYR